MVALSLGCAAGYARTPAPVYGSASEAADAALVDAINGFGFRVLTSMAVPDENAIVSPVSLHSLLTDIRTGARGDTADEMDAVLGIVDSEAVLSKYANLITRLRGVDGATVNVANAVWFDEGFEPTAGFTETNTGFFGAEIKTGELGSAQTASEIDDWISDHTAGRITDAAIEPDQLLSMELVNTLYFLGKWDDAFKTRDTQPQAFHFEVRYPSDVDMMHADGEYLYAEDSTAQMVMLPYKDGDVVAYVLVPTGEQTIGDVVAGLNGTTWRDRVASLEEREGFVAMPRVELTTSAEGLESVLATMGMPTAFGADADLSGIGSSAAGHLTLSRLVHHVYLRVDEKGTEAAAVSIGGVETASVEVDVGRFYLTADRPFLFAIVEEESGCLLFAGVIGDPRW